MKYIDTEKVISEVKRYKNKADERLKIKGRTFGEEQKDVALQNLCGNLLHFIDSLQQEQEQPDMDLEEYIENEINHYGLSLYEASYGTFSASQIDRIIRNAFELGLNARKEE